METLERTLGQLYNRFCMSAKRTKILKLALAINAVIFLSAILSGLIIVNVRSVYQTSSTISSVGTLKAIGVEVYWNDDLTNRVRQINWGFLKPGAQKSYIIYVSNEGNCPLIFHLSTSNWNPSSASNYLTLTWNHNGQAISAGEAVQVTLTLTVSETIAGINNFNFDIIAEGTA